MLDLGNFLATTALATATLPTTALPTAFVATAVASAAVAAATIATTLTATFTSAAQVLDLGNFLAGPVVSMHLGAMGADVIKLERITGDDSRAIGPMAADGDTCVLRAPGHVARLIATRLSP